MAVMITVSMFDVNYMCVLTCENVSFTEVPTEYALKRTFKQEAFLD